MLQSSAGWLSFFAITSRDNNVIASVHFNIENEFAKSPLRAPYGSFEFSAKLPETCLDNFVDFVELKLRELQIKSVVIKNYPECYFVKQHALLRKTLLIKGYIESNKEISAVLHISADPFSSHLHRSEKKRLRKCERAGLRFERLPTSSFDHVYSLVDQWRLEKKYSVSMSRGQLKEAVTMFPDRYIFFGVMDQHEIVAASICIAVSDDILYDFAHDHNPQFDHVSPIVMLVGGIYNYCFENSIPMLDLGTSTVDGQTKDTLLEFKLRMGAKQSIKSTFQKSL